MDDNVKTDVAQCAMFETVKMALAKLIAEKLRDDPNPKSACARWFAPIQETHLRHLAEPGETLDRAMSQAYVDASISLRELTDAMLD